MRADFPHNSMRSGPNPRSIDHSFIHSSQQRAESEAKRLVGWQSPRTRSQPTPSLNPRRGPQRHRSMRQRCVDHASRAAHCVVNRYRTRGCVRMCTVDHCTRSGARAIRREPSGRAPLHVHVRQRLSPTPMPKPMASASVSGAVRTLSTPYKWQSIDRHRAERQCRR
jgi:hypothetical protein